MKKFIFPAIATLSVFFSGFMIYKTDNINTELKQERELRATLAKDYDALEVKSKDKDKDLEDSKKDLEKSKKEVADLKKKVKELESVEVVPEDTTTQNNDVSASTATEYNVNEINDFTYQKAKEQETESAEKAEFDAYMKKQDEESTTNGFNGTTNSSN